MFGYRADEILGAHLSILIPQDFRDAHEAHMAQFKASPIVSRQMFERGAPIQAQAKDGRLFPVEISISKIDVDGKTEFTAVVRDVSERARLIDQLRDQATLDSLTGLLNRRAFLDRAEREVALAQRHEHALSVLMLDIDKFKEINDRHGHDGGDMVMKAIAAASDNAFRKTDICARVGGDEFAALLPLTDLREAMVVAKRLCDVIATQKFEMDWSGHRAIPFTASIGVAEFTRPDERLTDVLRRADKALYKAKEAGRNCVKMLEQSASSNALELAPTNTFEPAPGGIGRKFVHLK